MSPMDIDTRILSTSFALGDWPLSRVFLKNEQAYPWFILVPRTPSIQEIYQLNKNERMLLMEEINQLSLFINEHFHPYKLNIGALGNIVSQLHIHVVGRKQDDPLWPQGIWQSAMQTTPYTEDQLNQQLPSLREKISLLAQKVFLFGL